MLSVRSVSKPRLIECPDEDDETPWEHDEISSFPLGREGLEPGCYVPGKGGRSFSFEVSYSEYGLFTDELCQMVFGVDEGVVRRKYPRYRGKPFLEILAVSPIMQGDTVGPKTCAKLHGDFVAFARTAREHFAQKDIRLQNFPDYRAGPLMWSVYRNFRKAFNIGSDHGFVCYW